MLYRKRPVTIEAQQVPASGEMEAWGRITAWMQLGGAGFRVVKSDCGNGSAVRVDTLEGSMLAYPGDWILRGVNGEFYPCKDDIFRKTYDPVDSDQAHAGTLTEHVAEAAIGFYLQTEPRHGMSQAESNLRFFARKLIEAAGVTMKTVAKPTGPLEKETL